MRQASRSGSDLASRNTSNLIYRPPRGKSPGDAANGGIVSPHFLHLRPILPTTVELFRSRRDKLFTSSSLNALRLGGSAANAVQMWRHCCVKLALEGLVKCKRSFERLLFFSSELLLLSIGI